jgi:tol-pal system protein YbgF
VKKLPLILLLSGLWSIPAHAGIFDDTEARKMISDLQKTNQEQDAKYQALLERLNKLETQLKNLRIVELVNQLDATREDVNKLRGQIEVQNHQLETTQKRQKDFYVDLDARLRQLEPGGGEPAKTTAEPKTTEPKADTKPADKPSDSKPEGKAADKGSDKPDPKLVGNETGSYDAALALYKGGKYEDSIRSFSGFLKNFPESKLAANSLYWIAMSQSAMRDYKTAINTQQKLLNLFPDSSKAPDAMLNIGMNQVEMGDNKAAKKTFADLIAKYPIAPAADKARRLQNNLK